MNRFGWIAFGLAALYFIFLIRQDIIDNLELRREIRAVSQKNEQAQAEQDELSRRLARLKGDDLIEELARTRLGLIKKGEVAFKVIP